MKNRITKSAVKTIVLVILCVMSVRAYSQERFNKVINLARESNHVLVSVTPINGNYILICGTYELYGDNMCSLIAKIDRNGDCQYKTIICDEQNDVTEGKETNQVFYTPEGTYKYVFNVKNEKAMLCEFNDSLEIIEDFGYPYSNGQRCLGFFIQDSNVYLSGQYHNSEGYHGYIEKYDSDGNIVSNLGFEETYSEQNGFGQMLMQDNNIFVTGTMLSNGKMLWHLMKLDTSLNIIWQRTFGRSGWNNGTKTFLYPSPDSSYVMSGMYPVCSGNSAQCVRKIDDSGNLLWEKVIKNYYSNYYNGPGMFAMEKTFDVYVDDESCIYVVGNGANSSVGQAGFLTKLSPRGNIMYRRFYTPDGSQNGPDIFLTSIKPTPDGGFIMGGYTYDDYYTAEDFGDYYQQPWLVKTDHDGLDGLCYTELPELTLDVFIPDTVCNMDTIDCVVNISGPSAPYTLEFGTGQVIDSIYYPDIFVPSEIGIDTVLSGDLMYNYTENVAEATIKDTAENIIARHYNIATPTLPGEQQLAITLTDYYGNTKTIYKDIYVNACHEVEVDDNENVVLSVYPNPARENIMVDGENIAGIQICNLLGSVVYETQQCNGSNVISMDGMGAGSYFVRITMEDGKVVTKKIVVVR